MTTGDKQAGAFDTIPHPTVHIPAWGGLPFSIELQALKLTDGQNATIGMIVNNGTTTTCTRADIQTNRVYPSVSEAMSQYNILWNLSQDTTDGVTTLWDTTNMVESTSDRLLANSSYSLNGSRIVANSSTSYSVYSSELSSGLSIGAKIAIGVVVPAVVLVFILAVLFFLRRRRHARTPAALISSASAAALEKPELQGAGYDSPIADPVKSKSELATKGSRMRTTSKSPLQETSTELPVAGASSSSRGTRFNDGYMPAELGHNPISFEMAHSRAPQLETRHHNQTSLQVSTTDSSATAVARPNPGQYDEALASEADLLVQELGLINMPKKVLANAANAPGIRSEDLPGQREEDYREPVQREAKLRARIDEINLRSGNG